MAVSVPGLSLSILRQQTSVQAGLPLLCSGRFTAFGLGVPAFIRVLLEGPSYDPQIRSFDTFSSPFSGDYTVNVIAEKDGRYNVYAQAFPPPIIPTGPPFPDPILLLPPMAESTRPPLVVGFAFNGGVDALMPDGTTQRLSAPPMQPIEFRPLITVGAPGVTVSIPGFGAVPRAAIPWFPALPGAPPAPPPLAPPVTPPVEAIARAAIDDILFSPDEINPGMEAIGVMTWRNTGDAPELFDTVFYLVSPQAVRYGPLQVNQEVSAHPQVPTIQNLRLNTEGMPSGVYSVAGEIYDVTTGALIAAVTLPSRLKIREIAPPVVPLPPPPPVVPAAPTIDILGTPSLNLPNQINVGDVWQGSFSLPTFGTVPFFGEAALLLRDPTGAEYIVAQGGKTLQPGETLEVPVNYDTTGFAAGDYTILLGVFDQMGNQITEFPMGFLSMIAAVLPPVPTPPVIPTAPTADMFGTPSVNLPTELEIGEIWQGDITIPTMVPPALQALPLPSLPSLPLNIGLQLQNPAGQLFDVAAFPRTFTPGQPITLPINFDTSVLPQEGIHNLFMNISDLQGNTLFSGLIGMLRALMPAIPPFPPEVPLSKYPSIEINLGPSEVTVGESIDIPVTFTHVGTPEVALLYVSMGQFIGGVYDEVWHAEETVSVNPDPVPASYQETVTIRITPKLMAAGIYTVEAKIDGGIPRVLTRSLNIVSVLEVAPPVLLPRADIADFKFQIVPTGPLDPGDTGEWIATGKYRGRAQEGRLTISLGTGPVGTFFTRFTLPPNPVNFDESYDWRYFSFSGSFTLPPDVEPGQTYSTRARLESILEPAQETDTDWGVITIVAEPEVPFSQFPSCTVSLPYTRVTYGDSVTIPVSFVHSGKREGIRIYAAIGNYGAFGFDEVLHGERDWAVPDDMTPRERTVNITIPITQAIAPKVYAIQGKVMRIETRLAETVSDPVTNVVEVYAAVPVGPSRFSDMSVAYPTAPVRRGDTLSLQVNFRHQGQGESEWLYAAVGNDGVFGFDEILNNRRAITVPDEAEPTFHSEIINIPITTAIRPGVYDVYAKIGLGVTPRAISPTSRNVIRITG